MREKENNIPTSKSTSILSTLKRKHRSRRRSLSRSISFYSLPLLWRIAARRSSCHFYCSNSNSNWRERKVEREKCFSNWILWLKFLKGLIWFINEWIIMGGEKKKSVFEFPSEFQRAKIAISSFVFFLLFVNLALDWNYISRFVIHGFMSWRYFLPLDLCSPKINA